MSNGPTSDWDRLVAIAQTVVESTLDALPKRLQTESRGLPITYEGRPNRALIADGIESDTLGLFVGDSFADKGITDSPLPSQVILFLRNIWELAEGDEPTYRHEVRTTLLHELGHYLGLDEEGLTERGLD